MKDDTPQALFFLQLALLTHSKFTAQRTSYSKHVTSGVLLEFYHILMSNKLQWMYTEVQVVMVNLRYILAVTWRD